MLTKALPITCKCLKIPRIRSHSCNLIRLRITSLEALDALTWERIELQYQYRTLKRTLLTMPQAQAKKRASSNSIDLSLCSRVIKSFKRANLLTAQKSQARIPTAWHSKPFCSATLASARRVCLCSLLKVGLAIRPRLHYRWTLGGVCSKLCLKRVKSKTLSPIFLCRMIMNRRMLHSTKLIFTHSIQPWRLSIKRDLMPRSFLMQA